MNKVEFETILQEVIGAVEDVLLSKPEFTAFNILIKTRTRADYKISKWKAFNNLTIEKVESNHQLLDLALLVVATKYVAAIPYEEIIEIYAEAVKE